MSNVDKVIFDALAGRQSVILPELGSLEVKRRKPKQISETQIIPPQNVVLFSETEAEKGSSIANLLVAAGESLSKKEARALYEEWLAGARSGGVVTIENVGEIKDGKFVIAAPLHTALNPTNEEEIITMEEKKNNNRTWLWLLIGLLIAALIVGGILCWKKGGFDYRKNTPTEVVAPVIVPVPEPVAEPVVETVAPQGPRFHVIAGSFSIESNADNFMAKVKREHPELTPEKVVNPRNGYKMVSIFNAPTERQAYNKMNQYWDIDLYLWVYEQK